MTTVKSQIDIMAAKYWQNVSRFDRHEASLANVKVDQYLAAATRDSEKSARSEQKPPRLRL
jgi:hypothetical protein